MRIHSNTLVAVDFREVLDHEHDAGRIASSVSFKELTVHGSQSHVRAFEVQLESWGKVDGDGRRSGNSGSYGPMGYDSNYAATWDEWGWLLAGLFQIDPRAVCGSAKHPTYDGLDDFDNKTAFTYNPPALIGFLRDEGGDPYPYVRKGSRRVGRSGQGRLTTSEGERLAYSGLFKWEPRDVHSYAEWAHYKLAKAVGA